MIADGGKSYAPPPFIPRGSLLATQVGEVEREIRLVKERARCAVTSTDQRSATEAESRAAYEARPLGLEMARFTQVDLSGCYFEQPADPAEWPDGLPDDEWGIPSF